MAINPIGVVANPVAAVSTVSAVVCLASAGVIIRKINKTKTEIEQKRVILANELYSVAEKVRNS